MTAFFCGRDRPMAARAALLLLLAAPPAWGRMSPVPAMRAADLHLQFEVTEAPSPPASLLASPLATCSLAALVRRVFPTAAAPRPRGAPPRVRPGDRIRVALPCGREPRADESPPVLAGGWFTADQLRPGMIFEAYLSAMPPAVTAEEGVAHWAAGPGPPVWPIGSVTALPRHTLPPSGR